ncbi:crustacean hyperglycemic hormone-like [Dermacentor albipictus]|uniref:crustacean hyperglycemic hormone-like n=1 Tax=Dermacentor albipictus TaxID=60249 RepID=UPI0038FD0BB3
MSASFPVVPARWLAAALLVCSLMALTQPGGCAARKPLQRTFVEQGCRGHYERSYMARLERVCEECYQLYREPQVYHLCRGSCFRNGYFNTCAQDLLLDDEMPKLRRMINYLYA